jgi:hypothetical protein
VQAPQARDKVRRRQVLLHDVVLECHFFFHPFNKSIYMIAIVPRTPCRHVRNASHTDCKQL